MKSTVLSMLLICTSLAAQGKSDYLNVETPHVKPLDIAVVDGRNYLLVCNSADNAVEVWDTDTNATKRFLLRIPVGLEPNTVKWNPGRKAFYTTDFLGDSITCVSLFHIKNSIRYSLIRTRNLGTSDASMPAATGITAGDEPMDIAILPDGSALVVTSNSASTATFLHPWTLEPVAVGALPATVVPMNVAGNHALKEPRRVIARESEIFVLAFKGGNAVSAMLSSGLAHDLDLVAINTTTGARRSWGGLGSTNAGMAMADNGDLYVVGGLARNDLLNGPAVQNAPTGFVQSMIWVVRNNGNNVPGSGPALGRDLNNSNPGGTLTAVPYDDALANPRDVVIYDPGTGDPKIFVSAMGSDRIAVLTDNGGAPSTWPLARIELTPTAIPYTTQRGPRGMVLKAGTTGSPTPLIYVLNRVANSVTVINAVTNAFVEELTLTGNPTPAYVTAGRPFLYNARLSANGFGSCASCHMDGRTDSLSWNLGSMSGYREEFKIEFVDSPFGADQALINGLVMTGFEPDKGRMVTQTLQGLVNYQVAGSSQDLVSNQPYHWRGDRLDFLSFNEGFVGILGRPDGNAGGSFTPPDGRPDLPMGLPNSEMIVFRDFVESIHYPPNPRQLLNRNLSGDFGTDPNDIFDGSGALAGLKAFHTVPTLNGRSCVHCHALPEGSNNLFTFTEAGDPARPLESAAMRGLVQRERTLTTTNGQPSNIIVSNFGLLSSGSDNGINTFEDRFAGFYVPLEEAAGQAFDRTAIMNFVHELDWGMAPMVGQSLTLGNNQSALELQRLTDFEAQCNEGHVGLAVLVQYGNLTREAYRFDPIANLYRSESGGNDRSRSSLLGVLVGNRDRAFFKTTPLGSDRRVASLSGVASAPPVTTVGSVSLLSMVPIPANQNVQLMTKNWTAAGGLNFVNAPFNNILPSALTLRLLQYAQTQDASPSFGLNTLRHDAPRRFRIAATGLQPGAKLYLGIWPDVDPTVNPLTAVPTRLLELNLYPTSDTENNVPVWETAVELDVREYLILMAGGPNAPGVAAALSGTLAEPPPVGTFAPNNWNLQFVSVQNPGQPIDRIGWQPLSIQ